MPDVPQTDFTLLGIRILFCLVPVALFMLTMPILLKYPITRASHAKLVEELRRDLS
jgi:Na+/melibiose symporter-like transporter